VDRSAASDLLDEIATLLALKGENPFKVRAFENASRALGSLADFDERARKGDFSSVKGVGKAISEVLSEYSGNGRSSVLEELRQEVPTGVRDLLRIPGLGPKKATVLWKDLGVTSLGELEYAIKENRLITLPGFGEKTQEKLGSGIRFLSANSGRFRLDEAYEQALAVRSSLLGTAGKEAGVTTVEIAGDLRRGFDSVSEVVLVVACHSPAKLSLPADGTPPVRLVPCSPADFVRTLFEETGPAEHVREILNATGVQAPVSFESEEHLYQAAGMAFLPPELRDDPPSIASARSGVTPVLLTVGDVRGLFHVHSTYSDGKATLAETFQRVVKLGFSYVGITDHSPAAAYAGGLTPERIQLQWAEIESLRSKFPTLTVFKGTEADILSDGSIDYGDDFLAGFDFVIASVHSAFRLPRAQQTERLVRAVRNPRVTMLGHPTGRILLAREGIDADWDAVYSAAAESGCGAEINASPYRLDLDWEMGRRIRSTGIFTSINPDAHELAGLSEVPYGVRIARRAGFAPGNVLNAKDAAGASEKLRELRSRPG
jgi:DNA polymerase (family 10)